MSGRSSTTRSGRRARSPCRSTRRPPPSRSSGSCPTRARSRCSTRPTRTGRRTTGSRARSARSPTSGGSTRRPSTRSSRRARASARTTSSSAAAPSTSRASPRSSTRPAPPAGPRAASSPTATSCSTHARRPRGSTTCSVPTSRRCCSCRWHTCSRGSSRSVACRTVCEWVTPPTSRTCWPTSRRSSRRSSCPCRGCSRRSTTRRSRRRTPMARGRSSTWPSGSRSPTARRSTATRCSGSHSRGRTACSTRWSTPNCARRRAGRVQRRAGRGGRVQGAISGGARLGARLGHFYRGIGVPIYEGYGLTETTAGATCNRPDAQKVGTVGRPIPGVTVRIADDGEILLQGDNVFTGYFNNAEATKEALEGDRWFHTGDIGELDAAGYLRITGRKKELIVAAGGKNVAPAVLEDRIRANPLISQCMVVGDQKPFIACLVTIDEEAFPDWKKNNGKSSDASVADLVDDDDLRAAVQSAIDDANKAVSHAESIKAFRIVADDWTIESGHLTPSLKLKRNVVLKDHAKDIEALYSKPKK